MPNIIVVDSDGLFAGMFKKTFQENLIIPVHVVARINHKAIRNKQITHDKFSVQWQTLSMVERIIFSIVCLQLRPSIWN